MLCRELHWQSVELMLNGLKAWELRLWRALYRLEAQEAKDRNEQG